MDQPARQHRGGYSVNSADRCLKQVDDQETVASVRNTRGNILLEQHQHKRALDEYKSAAEHYRECGDGRMQRMVEHNMGATLMRMGNAKGALPYLRSELDGCRADHDELGEAHALNTLGLALLDMDDIDNAREVLAEAIAHYQRLGDAIHASHATNDLGLALTAAGEHEIACECHLSDYAICTELGDMHGAGRALIRVADNLIRMGTQHVSDALSAATCAAQLIDERDLVVLARWPWLTEKSHTRKGAPMMHVWPSTLLPTFIARCSCTKRRSRSKFVTHIAS